MVFAVCAGGADAIANGPRPLQPDRNAPMACRMTVVCDSKSDCFAIFQQDLSLQLRWSRMVRVSEYVEQAAAFALPCSEEAS